ncbi:hypothetical protein COU61_04820 [Candidatus Pacearchaeota archaeon CG10_big_fil_rev_8_21_14_0_10_35_13]|nr:MAG: hypothetical protein COU61_04820 [Candidatus Pacearchaeota archaeon CG10_big_fil_rev_8_21_14_0_10_35_13]
MVQERINVSYPKAISALESAMRKFLLKRIIYRILFRGKGIEFDSYRTYMPDDDANNIDWKASYRANKTLVKQYIEERDIRILFILDTGSNMVFGSGAAEKLKCEYAAEVVASLAHLIITSGDKVGFMIPKPSGGYEMAKPVAGTKRYTLFTDIISRTTTYGGVSRIEETMEELLKHLDRGLSGVYIISDFMNISKNFRKTLNALSTQVETIGIMIRDPLERKLPTINAEVTIEDPQTGKQLVMNPSVAKRNYDLYARNKEMLIKKIFDSTPADFLELVTDKFFPFYLTRFLKKRAEEKASPIVVAGY